MPFVAGTTTKFSTGILYVYRRVNADSDFLFEQAIQAPNAKAYDSLAFQSTSLVIRGNYIAAGASNAEEGGSGKFSHGSVFLWSVKSLPNADGTFTPSWQSEETFAPVDQLDSYDYFGAAVHMCIRDGQPLLAIGAYGKETPLRCRQPSPCGRCLPCLQAHALHVDALAHISFGC